MKSEMNIKFESGNLKRRDPSKDGCRWQDNITCHTEIWSEGMDWICLKIGNGDKLF
jgi:hypothetical protein